MNHLSTSTNPQDKLAHKFNAWLASLLFFKQPKVSKSTALKITCDSAPLRSFTELFEAALKVRNLSLDLGNLTFELARIDTDFSAASAGELTVRLYPSDAFLRFAAAVLAGNFDLGTIKETGH